MKVGIVVAKWNPEITEALYKAAVQTLLSNGCSEADIISTDVPGSFELTLGAQWLAERGDLDAVICLGCVIQGETRHFDFICQAVAMGITNLCIKFSMPVIFGLLTPENQEQAIDRAGGKHGNKGVEAAITTIKMVALRKKQ